MLFLATKKKSFAVTFSETTTLQLVPSKLQENGPGLHGMQCKGPNHDKTKLTHVTKTGEKIKEADTNLRGKNERHDMDT